MVKTLTVPEAAVRLGLSVDSVRRRYQTGVIKIVEPSEGERRVLIPVCEIERLERLRKARKPARRTKDTTASSGTDRKSAAAGGD